MKVGDNVWFFANKGTYIKKKYLMRGTLILRNKPYWHIKSDNKFYKKKESEVALVNASDKKLFLI